jgi:hypothetical protein
VNGEEQPCVVSDRILESVRILANCSCRFGFAKQVPDQLDLSKEYGVVTLL